jgi:hypothetical protein
MNENGVFRKRSRAEIEELIAEYERSGLRQQDFAAQAGIKLTTFRYWFYRRCKSVRPKLVEVEVGPPPVSGPAHYRLELPGGAALSFSGPVRAEELEELWRLLRSS